MPGVPEFTQAVGGSEGAPVATTQTSAFEVDNYQEGGAFTVGDGTTAYPLSVDPAEYIQELVITETGTDIRADIVTKSGTQINDVHLRGAVLAEGKIEMDSITFKDPNATGAATFGYWVGE